MKHLWEVSLLRKDTEDLIDSLVVEGDNKFEAGAAATREFRELYPEFHTYAYIWVRPKEGQKG